MYTLTPDVSGIGLTFDASSGWLTGTPTSAQAKVTYTYRAMEASDPDGTPESASVTFSIGIKPGQPANFEVISDGSLVTLSWTAIAGVSGWEYRKDGGRWRGIAGGGATSVTLPLPNGATATFAVRSYVGAGDTRLDAGTSGAVTATVEIDYDTTSAGLIYDDGNGLIEISTLASCKRVAGTRTATGARTIRSDSGSTTEPSPTPPPTWAAPPSATATN